MTLLYNCVCWYFQTNWAYLHSLILPFSGKELCFIRGFTVQFCQSKWFDPIRVHIWWEISTSRACRALHFLLHIKLHTNFDPRVDKSCANVSGACKLTMWYIVSESIGFAQYQPELRVLTLAIFRFWFWFCNSYWSVHSSVCFPRLLRYGFPMICNWNEAPAPCKPDVRILNAHIQKNKCMG